MDPLRANLNDHRADQQISRLLLSFHCLALRRLIYQTLAAESLFFVVVERVSIQSPVVPVKQYVVFRSQMPGYAILR